MSASLFQRLGLVGTAGLAMMAGAAYLHWHWLPSQRAAVSELESQTRHARHDLQARVAQGAAADTHPVQTGEQAWQKVWLALPQAEQRLALQGALFKAARDQHLTMDTVQYRGAREPWFIQSGSVLWRQRVTMPVDGSYPNVRAWLMQVLKQPALSVDALDIQRSDVMSDAVKAQVSVSLWWRAPEKGQP